MTHRRPPCRPALFLLIVILLAVPTAQASDWARWLGPNQDGTATERGLFPTEGFGLAVGWSRPLGVGYSGIAVFEGRAVTMFGDGELDWLTALDAKSGKELWRYKIDTMYAAHDGSEGGPNGMSVIDDGVVYGLGASGHLFAVRLEDGKEIWSLRIDEKLGARAPSYGFTTTPLVAGDALFVQTGGDEGRGLTAFDKRTGEVLWSTGDDGVSYESPILATVGGREQILAVTKTRVLGLIPESGEILWSHEHGMIEEANDGYATPVLLGDDRFLLTGQQESKAFRLVPSDGGFTVDDVWTSTDLKQSLATPVFHEGHLYGFSGEFLTCVDPATGEKVWKSRPPGGRGLVLVDGHLVIFANDGAVVVVEASPEAYREKARVEVSKTGSYTYPSVADGRIFVRNTTDLAAVTVSAASQVAQRAAEPAPPRNDFERFVRRLEQADDKRLLVDDFMNSQKSFPIVEDDRWVHFVYRGEVEDIAITGTMTEFRVEAPMQRVEGTDLYYRTYPIEPGARYEYRLNVDFENLQPDPLNPRRVPGDEGDLSEVLTSGWRPPDYMKPYRGDRPGRLESFKLASEILENEREIQVYLPPGSDDAGVSYPLVVVIDGKDWLDKAHMTNTLNHLTGGRLAPVIVAFVESPQGTARNELGGDKSADYVRMLVDELVPELEDKYPTRTGPAARAIMGVANAGLMAVYAAVERPDVFGKAGGCSFYVPSPPLLETIEKRAGHAKNKASFWVVWNRYELARAEWDVDLARDSRRVADALESKGLTVVKSEAMDSSGWGGWRVRGAELLQGFFPR